MRPVLSKRRPKAAETTSSSAIGPDMQQILLPSLISLNLHLFKSCLEIRYQSCSVVKPMTLIVFFAGTREDNLLANDIFLWQVCKHEEAEIWLNDHRSNSLRCSNPRHSALECVHTLPSLKYIVAAVFGLKDDQQCQGNACLHLILTFFFAPQVL